MVLLIRQRGQFPMRKTDWVCSEKNKTFYWTKHLSIINNCNWSYMAAYKCLSCPNKCHVAWVISRWSEIKNRYNMHSQFLLKNCSFQNELATQNLTYIKDECHKIANNVFHWLQSFQRFNKFDNPFFWNRWCNLFLIDFSYHRMFNGLWCR